MPHTPEENNQELRKATLATELENQIRLMRPSQGINALKSFYCEIRGESPENEALAQAHNPLIFIVAQTLREMRKKLTFQTENTSFFQHELLQSMTNLSEELTKLMWTTGGKVEVVKN